MGNVKNINIYEKEDLFYKLLEVIYQVQNSRYS